MLHIQSVQPTLKKNRSCRWSDITVFSFHPVKIITTGEGDGINNNKKFADEMRILVQWHFSKTLYIKK